MGLTPDEREAVKWFSELPRAEQERLHESLRDLFAKLRAKWEADPETRGKSVTYTELWNRFMETE